MNPERKRKRTFARRSRTGCRTCRIRHVKCDETPVACKNCASAGWKCDGYQDIATLHSNSGKQKCVGNQKRDDSACANAAAASPLRITTATTFPSTIVTRTPLLARRNVRIDLPGNRLDERRGFAYFQAWTLPRLNSVFETDLWNNIVLPMGHSEQAVAHAIVAVSALHEDMEARGVPLPRADLKTSRQRFALEQYTRAISSLKDRAQSQDTQLRQVIVTACLLFVMFELLRGQYHDAFLHLRQGLALMNAMRIRLPQYKFPEFKRSANFVSDDAFDECISKIMNRLCRYPAFFGEDTSEVKDFQPDSTSCVNFNSTSDVREGLDKLSQDLSRSMEAVRKIAVEEGVSDQTRNEIESVQKFLRWERTQFQRKLDQLMAKILPPVSARCERALSVIRLQLASHDLVVESYLDTDDTACDSYTNKFSEIVSISEHFVNSFWDDIDSKGSRPTFLLDDAIIPSLLLVCLRCPYVSIREKALRILRAWPHREGPWDSNLVAMMGSMCLQIEREAEFERLMADPTVNVSSLQDITYISSPSRIINQFISLDHEEGSAILSYYTKDSGLYGQQLQMRVPLDQPSKFNFW